MSLFKRISGILRKPEPPKPEKSLLTLGPGDICEVSLVTYEVIGKTQNVRRRETFLSLQDGTELRYLHIEDRQSTEYTLYAPVDGRMDSIEEIPSTMELDGRDYYLEENYSSPVQVTGRSPHQAGGELHVWQYQSDDRRLLRIEWQEGRILLYEGESILTADVKVLRGS
ncbi:MULTISPECIES: DUF4178 domain-containing protein [unclassified Paenibacillus]|uniref:DUF4178 domain-containing protein n=1 Tax=unclassified Paenibacillus TaxID=185978 RepID=UPI0009553C9C|nr:MULTISPECIES: DUF4178 domain-containing protein [unclassified Paenibacillus]ASS64904.1 DUF4178 domain-containing protein [Paenibacillus sp. RUD330]SIR02021.1 protein of unknown function [Paenibacillus sp. RU4X]SIR33133.1 protein of unknown function [Paenibacillus sp. RU4T]